VTRAELLRAGVSSSAIGRALASGDLYRLYPCVYSVVPLELLSEDGALQAAVIAAGAGATLSHGTAAWRWKLIPAPPIAVELTVPRCRKSAQGLTLFESDRLRPTDLTHNGPFPSTSVPRTILDLAARYDRRALLRVLAEAEFEHAILPEDLLAVLRRGHPGSAALRQAIKLHVPGHGEARSRLERRFRALLIAHHIELPERNQPLGPYTVDCLWREQRVVVELDGDQHARPHQANLDRERDLWLRAHGYNPLRYGGAQITDDPDAVASDLLAALGAICEGPAHDRARSGRRRLGRRAGR
jgi:very-short-patch-repair endonuclease